MLASEPQRREALSREHRYHERLCRYWDELRGNRPYPNENEIDPADIEELWPSCFLVAIDSVTKSLGYRYSYLGQELVEAYGEDADHSDVIGILVSPNTIGMVDSLDEVVRTGKPVVHESSFVNLKRVEISYRACMLPLGGPNGEVTYIIGCMRWKAH